MPVITLIAAMDTNGGMGKDNRLLCHLPADLAHFKALTLGKPVIMGRRTYDSIGRALPNRMNVVLSRNAVTCPGAIMAASWEDALHIIGDVSEVMVIGGADIFQLALPFAKKIHQTVIHYAFDSDVFFPTINWSDWLLVDSVDRLKDEKNPYDLTFNCYELASFEHKAKNK